MSNTTETLISQEPNNFTSQVSINNKIQQLTFNFPVELQKHFPHGVLDAQIGLEKSAFQEQSEGGTEYESVNGKVNELEKKQSTAAVLKNDLMDLFGRRELKSLWDKQIAENTAKRDELKDIVASLRLKIKDIILENSLLALVLMLVAALAFISADFIISYTVVSTQLLLNGQILNSNSFYEMTTFVGSGNYGMGISQATVIGRTVWTHGGTIWGGYNSSMMFDTETGIIICVLINQLPAQAIQISIELLSTLINNPLGLHANTSTEKLITVYPNPTNEKLQISLGMSRAAELEIEVLDLLGKSHLHLGVGSGIHEDLNLDVSSLSSGVYLLQVKTEGQVTVKKFVKN